MEERRAMGMLAMGRARETRCPGERTSCSLGLCKGREVAGVA